MAQKSLTFVLVLLETLCRQSTEPFLTSLAREHQTEQQERQ